MLAWLMIILMKKEALTLFSSMKYEMRVALMYSEIWKKKKKKCAQLMYKIIESAKDTLLIG